MADLTKDEIRAMGHAVGLEINDPELTEVTYSLNALLESLDAINSSGPERRRAPAHHPAPGVSIARRKTLKRPPKLGGFFSLRGWAAGNDGFMGGFPPPQYRMMLRATSP